MKQFVNPHRASTLVVLSCGLALNFAPKAQAQMVANADMKNFGAAFGLPQINDQQENRGDDPNHLLKAQRNDHLSVQQSVSSKEVNILWPGEAPTYTFRFSNLGDVPHQLEGHVEVISFATHIETGDIWVPIVTRRAVENRTPIKLSFDADGTAQLTIKPNIPTRYGGYALIFDFGQYGRLWGAGITRVVKADEGRVFAPSYALDMVRPFQMTPLLPASFRKLGVKGARFGAGYSPTDSANYKEQMAQLEEHLKWAKANNISVMLTVDAGAAVQPLGRGRPWLDESGKMIQGLKEDYAWLPDQDADFQKWVQLLATKYGYPNGPVNGMELWNEPWEGVSISGWGADMLRYREIYKRMAAGIQAARKQSGVKVLIGGASSSSNTLDKFFPDGSNEFLPILDFASLHYQTLSAVPALIPEWQKRKGPEGRVRVWDTESWVANSEDRIAAVVASMRAMGYDRVMGTFGGNVFTLQTQGNDAATSTVVQTWPAAAASGAVTKFIGERAFDRILLKGLPWIFTFKGLPQKGEDDGTVVVVGDLSGVYDRDATLYRGVYGLRNAPRIAQIREKLAALSPESKPEVRTALEADLKRESVLQGGTLTLPDGSGKFRLLDFYGNVVPSRNGKIVVPLNGLGYFLRTNGSKGSYQALLDALKTAHTTGYEPLEIVAHDFTAPLSKQPLLRLSLTNILNRPVKGQLRASIAGLQLEKGNQTLNFAPGETKQVYVRAVGKVRADNHYALQVSFDAGKDGTVRHSEQLSANVISRSTIQVDGKLDAREWQNAVPQTVTAPGIARSMTEAAWLPFKAFDANSGAGQTTAYTAYDDKNFYFAAKTADKTPDVGTLRFATRDDDQFFYPPVSYQTGDSTRRFAVRWTGFIEAPQDGIYTLTTLSDDGVRLWIDGKPVINNWTPHAPTEDSGRVELKAGQRVPIRLEFFQGEGGAIMQLFWQGANLTRQIVPSEALFVDKTEKTGNGLNGEYFNDATLQDFVVRRRDAKIDFSWQPGVLPDPAFSTGNDLQKMIWPKEVRRFSYRRDPELPSGNTPAHDNIQIAFNVIPPEKKAWLANSKGTPPRWQVYPDTDYEYALNTVTPQYGGGTEVWRLLVPGMPRKHFYPRQPASKFDGPAKGAKLVTRREGNTRILEASIPWTELPDVQRAMKSGQNIKFSFRVNDNNGSSYEFAQNRSVSKQNSLTFHSDWVTHWSNEVEWGWQR